VGFFAGPPLGSLLYTAGGYSTPFFTFAGILAGLAGLFLAAAFSERGTLNSADQRSAENATVAYRYAIGWRSIVGWIRAEPVACISILINAMPGLVF
jgi:hypothetical protein